MATLFLSVCMTVIILRTVEVISRRVLRVTYINESSREKVCHQRSLMELESGSNSKNHVEIHWSKKSG